MKTKTFKLTLTYILFGLLSLPSNGQNIDTLAGRHLYFDGSTNFVDTRDTSLYTNFTVECWVKSPNAPSNLQGKGPVHYEKNFQINWDHVSSGARNALLVNVSNGGWQSATFGKLEANTWYHLVGTYDGDTLKTYTNGRLVTKKSINGGSPSRQNTSLKIGKHSSLSGAQEYFNGSVDEVRVWNIERSSEQIQKNMFHPLSGNEPGLKHYYQFKEIVSDSTLNAATGKWAPLILSPQVQKSDFPFGKGISTVLNIQAGSGQFFNSIETGLVALQMDSVNRSFPLLFTKLNANFSGSKPDSNLFITQSNPYWIIQALDTGKSFRSKGMRLDYSALSPEFTINANQPSDIKVFNRPFSSSDEWQFVDTCEFIAFGSGHFIFKGFKEGQMALALSKTSTSISELKLSNSNSTRLFLNGGKELTLFFSKDDDFTEACVLDIFGRQVSNWQHAINKKVDKQVLIFENSLKSGLYFLRLKSKNSENTIRFVTD
jgi:hypothetical protein